MHAQQHNKSTQIVVATELMHSPPGQLPLPKPHNLPLHTCLQRAVQGSGTPLTALYHTHPCNTLRRVWACWPAPALTAALLSAATCMPSWPRPHHQASSARAAARPHSRCPPRSRQPPVQLGRWLQQRAARLLQAPGPCHRWSSSNAWCVGLDTQAHTHISTHARTLTHMHTHTHAQARAQTEALFAPE